MSRLDQHRQNDLEPKRIKKALEELNLLGFKIISQNDTKIVFLFNNHQVQYFPYSGWHTGKTIEDGRGWKHLFNQIKKQNS